MATDDLAHLLSRTALGDRTAFARLHKLTSGKLFAVCLRILHDRSEADDALQDAYTKIWRYAERYSSAQARPMTWMIAITRNVCIDRLRSRKPDTAALDAAEAVADAALRPDEKAMAKGEMIRLANCMNSLPLHHARIVRIAYFGGATYSALAEREGVPLGTMKSRMRAALAKLRECLTS